MQAIETERQREPTEKEIQDLRSDWQRIYELMDERKAPLREIEQARATYQKIARDLSKLRDRVKQKDNPERGGMVHEAV